MNSFGEIFRVSTFGESHGDAIGALIDGCPAGLPLSAADIQAALDERKKVWSDERLAKNSRIERDKAELLSGVFEGKTLGTPISILIRNEDAKSENYESLRSVFRPGHADFSWNAKFGFRDWRGGGRASGRETVARIAAGAVAKKLIFALHQIVVKASPESPLSADEILALREKGDSKGGIVRCEILNVPAGFGEPVFDKLDAKLAQAVFSVGAVKGLEFGDGFKSAESTGTANNDAMEGCGAGKKPRFLTNRCGGILGGISTGKPILMRIAVKPAPSVALPQKTAREDGTTALLEVRGRHDVYLPPKVAPAVEAMCAIAIADFALRSRSDRLGS